MPSTIRIKRSSVAGKKPTTSDISTSELALNTKDFKLYSSNGTAIFELANAGALANTNSRIGLLNTNLTGTNTALRTLISDRLQVANASTIYQTKAVERAALANTNASIATQATRVTLVNTNLTGTNTALRTLISDRLQVANAASVYQTKAVERAALANTNASIATQATRVTLVNTNLTGTNTALRTLISDRLQVANASTIYQTKAVERAALANTNSSIATQAARITLVNTNLTGTNTALRTLISDRLQVANASTLYATKSNPATSGLLAHTGRATISTNLTVSGNTTLGGSLKTVSTTGLLAHTGRATISTNLTVSGNVGIGTTSPDASLTINTIASFGDGAAATPSIAHKGDLNTGFWFPAADTIAASTAGTERMRITSAGDVGIGRSPSDGNKLSVQKAAGESVAGELFLTDSTHWTQINSRQGASQYNSLVQAGDHSIIYSNGAADDSAALVIGPWANSSKGLRIDSNGNVDGGVSFRAPIFYDSNNTAFYVDPASTSVVNTLTYSLLNGPATNTRDKIRLWSSTPYSIGMTNSFTFGALHNSEYAMTFQMNNDNNRGFWWGDDGHTTAQGAMSLSTNGKLTVAHSIRVGYGETDTTVPGATYRLDVDGSIVATGSITENFSDERLKTKLGNISKAVDIIKYLNGFRYINNETAKSFGYDSDQIQVGVSAQEVERVLPEIVSIAPFDAAADSEGNIISKTGENYKTVKYSKLVPVLVEAIKEQQEQIETLRKEINFLKGVN